MLLAIINKSFDKKTINIAIAEMAIELIILQLAIHGGAQ